MRSFGVHLQAPLHEDHALLGIAGLRKLFGGERTEEGNACVLRIKHESITLTLEAVRDNAHISEIGNVDISRADDGRGTVADHFLTDFRDTGKARHALLVDRADHQDLRRTASRPHLLDDALEDRLRERAKVGIHSIRTRRVRLRGVARVVTANALVGVGLQERQERAGATKRGRDASRASGGRLVRQHDRLHVALQLSRTLGELVGQLRTTASLVHRLERAREDDGLAADLRVVAHTDGRGRLVERRDVVTFDLRVGSRGSGKGVGLPLEERVLDVLAANVAHERGLFRRDVIDNIRERLADTLGGKGIVSVTGLGHLKLPQSINCAKTEAASRVLPVLASLERASFDARFLADCGATALPALMGLAFCLIVGRICSRLD